MCYVVKLFISRKQTAKVVDFCHPTKPGCLNIVNALPICQHLHNRAALNRVARLCTSSSISFERLFLPFEVLLEHLCSPHVRNGHQYRKCGQNKLSHRIDCLNFSTYCVHSYKKVTIGGFRNF